MTLDSESGGILSLGGFAFQIRVLVYYLGRLCKGSQIEFETIDDVAIKNNNIMNFLDTPAADQGFVLVLKADDGSK